MVFYINVILFLFCFHRIYSFLILSMEVKRVDDCIKKSRVRVLLDLSKELEIDYMKKFIGKNVSFIPEVSKDGFLIGHTGNYLLIKYKNSNLVHESINVTITDIDYPYCIGE